MCTILTIAGSDSGGGAGVQADLKTFEAHGVFGTSAITVLTAQNTVGITDIYEIKPEFVAGQINAVLDDFDIKAIKIGMLFSTEVIEAVKKALLNFKGIIVLDPVFVSKTNAPLLKEEAVDALKEMFDMATLITPNMHEAYRLFGYSVGVSDSLEVVRGQPCPVLIKNHQIQKEDESYSIDILYNKERKYIFETPLCSSASTHGTGCSYSAAITANLALGYTMIESIARAKRFIYFAVSSAPNIGKGTGPIAHKQGYNKMKIYYGEES